MARQEPTPKSEFSLRSENGDYIGVGQTYFYLGNLTPAAFDENGDGQVDAVRFLYFTPTNTESSWTLAFSVAKLRGNLIPGYYADAMLVDQETVGHPGLEVKGNFRYCDTVTGDFVVFDAVFDTTATPPKVVSFGVTFRQFCNGGKSALNGTLYFNSLAEPDVQKPLLNNVTLSRKKVIRSQDPSVMISWSSSDNTRITRHDLQFARDGETFSTEVATGLSGTTQSFNWTIGSAVKSTTSGLVKVIAIDLGGNRSEATSKKLRIK
ncbi:MAG: hypothetical protein K1Y36_28730 [Blastocatellia bacterium]|nr:hypothetical protein [Blastocatellia bacterium]